jgi:hypothetical protein
MKFLGTVVHTLTELLPIANIDEIFIIIISLNIISLRYNEETKKLRKPISNNFAPKQEKCVVIYVNFS